MKLYYANINDFNKEPYFINSIISSDKIKLLKKLRNEDDRKRCWISGIMVFFIINLGNIDNLCKSEKGKPFIKDKNIHFNVSHSGDYVVLVKNDEEVGVDLEKAVSFNHSKLVYEVFHKDEINIFNKYKNNSCFYKIWTRKESFLKWSGIGIEANLKGFSTVGNQKNTYDCKIGTFDFKDDYFISICSKKHGNCHIYRFNKDLKTIYESIKPFREIQYEIK
ncbi:4'-phosphopantetheinyl transferase superfamily protein [Helcococcus ovis]|uniref:4'-phosphopantetheinyl transferase family protein n=1 Tax=Helcococcus ovis TaxID=72026 RepID=UPI0038B89D84